MRVWAQSSHRSTCPPSAAVRHISMAVMTRRWVRLRWASLAARQPAPWRRKTSATSRIGRGTGASGRRCYLHVQKFERALDLPDGVDSPSPCASSYILSAVGASTAVRNSRRPSNNDPVAQRRHSQQPARRVTFGSARRSARGSAAPMDKERGRLSRPIHHREKGSGAVAGRRRCGSVCWRKLARPSRARAMDKEPDRFGKTT
jgi:hypothetical protein